ncbi:MAG: hypothetical protein ACI85K_001093 [Hyphomicrobiaceae bacterium]|jgi:uncharacterized protein YbaR (Trm112 family)
MSTSADVVANPLNEKTLALLRCPTCRASLRRSEQGLACSACRVAHPVVRGVPVLIDENRSVFRTAEVVAAQQAPPPPRTWKQVARRWLPRLEINFTGRDSVLSFKEKLLEGRDHPVVLNIGGKHDSSFSKLVSAGTNVDCIESHVAFAPRTNLVTDPHALPLADESIDAVIIDAVLEHVVDPVAVVSELFRVLKKDGLVYSDTPFMVQVHGGAFDFLRFSHLAHRMLYGRFRELDSGVSCGPASALAVSIQSFLLSFVRSLKARAVVKGVCCLSLFWLKYFDYLLVNKPGSLDAALGTFFVGQKSTEALSDRDLLQQYRGAVPHLFALSPAAGRPLSRSAPTARGS